MSAGDKEEYQYPGWLGLLVVIVAWIVLAATILVGRGDWVRVTGVGMRPYVELNDFLLMKPAGTMPERGGVVVFVPTSDQARRVSTENLQDTKGSRLAKVVGLPGDHLTIKLNQLHINGKIVSGLSPGPIWSSVILPMTVPEAKYFLLLGSSEVDKQGTPGPDSISMGLIGLQQLRTTDPQIRGSLIASSAPLEVAGGCALMFSVLYLFWGCGRYCQPSVLLRVVSALSAGVVLLLIAAMVAMYLFEQTKYPWASIPLVLHYYLWGRIGAGPWPSFLTSALLLFGVWMFMRRANTAPPRDAAISDAAPNKIFSWIAIPIVIIVIAIIVSAMFGQKDGDKAPSETRKPPEAAYRSAQALEYRKAMLEQLPIGTLLSFDGKISQTFGNRQAMISTKNTSFGYAGDRVFLTFEEKPQVIADDIVSIYGRYSGTTKYETIFGAEQVVPHITVDYYTVIKPRS